MKKRVLSLTLALIMCVGMIPLMARAVETAVPVPYDVFVNGQKITFAGYQADSRVYIRLRDAAKVLDAFDVQWDGQTIAITTGTSYTSTNGTEMHAPFAGNQPCAQTPGSVTVDGQSIDLTGILLTDQNGSGYSYFTPEDLETALGIQLNTPASEDDSALLEDDIFFAYGDPSTLPDQTPLADGSYSAVLRKSQLYKNADGSITTEIFVTQAATFSDPYVQSLQIGDILEIPGVEFKIEKLNRFSNDDLEFIEIDEQNGLYLSRKSGEEDWLLRTFNDRPVQFFSEKASVTISADVEITDHALQGPDEVPATTVEEFFARWNDVKHYDVEIAIQDGIVTKVIFPYYPQV